VPSVLYVNAGCLCVYRRNAVALVVARYTAVNVNNRSFLAHFPRSATSSGVGGKALFSLTCFDVFRRGMKSIDWGGHHLHFALPSSRVTFGVIVLSSRSASCLFSPIVFGFEGAAEPALLLAESTDISVAAEWINL